MRNNYPKEMMMMKLKKSRGVLLEKPLFLAIVIVAVVITGALTITSFSRGAGGSSAIIPTSILCTLVNSAANPKDDATTTPTHLAAILHYATSRVIAQQSMPEIRVTFNVLRKLGPCKFLVFGIGHDSLMWSSFNPGGTTLFLEDDMDWVHRTINNAPSLRVHAINYRTHLSDADELLSSYKSTQHCLPPDVYLKGNRRCQLALADLPEEVYTTEWDVILIDGPRGYYAEAPGRMSVIFTTAVMARARVRPPGVTHVLLHDIDRKVEKAYAEEFFCTKYRVRAEGRLWYFQIPTTGRMPSSFC